MLSREILTSFADRLKSVFAASNTPCPIGGDFVEGVGVAPQPESRKPTPKDKPEKPRNGTINE